VPVTLCGYLKGIVMSPSDRRTFLKLMGTPALAAAVPLDMSRILAIPAHNRTQTIFVSSRSSHSPV
jgi:hypothetical protein